jgi:hypothetical protein
MVAVIEQMAALPPDRMADGLFTTEALSKAIGYPPTAN